MSKRNLAEWLTYIESFHPSEIEMGLERIKFVATQLGVLPLSDKCVLVAGTNGKGSCVAMLEALALSKGKTVACYTSPHLLEFNERIRVNGKNIDDESLTSAFSQIEKYHNNVALTFFEFTTLAALLIFKYHEPDLIVLEVGLGGRMDATNIVEPDVSIITTVDKDHAAWLGDDLESIAFEKGGIMRSGKKTLIGDQKTSELVRKVLPQFESEISLVDRANENLQLSLRDVNINQNQLLEQNIMLAIKAMECCFNLGLDDISIIKALKDVRLSGRFQRLYIEPPTLVDVAHNPQSAHNLVLQVNEYIKTHNVSKVTAICGMMADKAIDEVLQILDPIVDSWCFVDLDTSRAISAKALQQIYSRLAPQASSHCYGNVAGAFERISKNCKNNELVLVFGSFITVANMIQYSSYYMHSNARTSA